MGFWKRLTGEESEELRADIEFWKGNVSQLMSEKNRWKRRAEMLEGTLKSLGGYASELDESEVAVRERQDYLDIERDDSNHPEHQRRRRTLTTPQIAERFDVSKATVRRLAKNGAIPSSVVRSGIHGGNGDVRRYLFSGAELDDVERSTGIFANSRRIGARGRKSRRLYQPDGSYVMVSPEDYEAARQPMTIPEVSKLTGIGKRTLVSWCETEQVECFDELAHGKVKCKKIPYDEAMKLRREVDDGSILLNGKTD